MLSAAVIALTESVCCVCRDKHHIKKNKKNPTEATNYNREDCIYVTTEATEAKSEDALRGISAVWKNMIQSFQK